MTAPSCPFSLMSTAFSRLTGQAFSDGAERDGRQIDVRLRQPGRIPAQRGDDDLAALAFVVFPAIR